MRKLSPVDTAFLLAETRKQPFHVGALCLFHPPEDAPEEFVADIASRLRESKTPAPPFNQRLESRWGMKSWVEAKDFDIGQHFVHLSLPKPGRVLELLSMVSRVHSAHLDRAYPLWRTYLIEGIEDGRIALYSKIHHSVVDGVAGLRLMQKTMTEDMEESLQMPAPWEIQPYKSTRRNLPADAINNALTTLNAIRSGALGTPKVLGHLQHVLKDFRDNNPNLVTSFQAPNCILNSSITGSRRFAAQSYSTARIKKIAEAFGATSNDVVLALCGSALRRYLQEQHCLPDRELVAVVPVSIRRDDSELGNEIAFSLCGLATDLSDPLERVLHVKGVMDYNKNMLSDMTSAQIMAYSLAVLAPGLFTFLPGIHNRYRAANLVISNVRGPQSDVFWQGCKLDGIYPASIVLEGFALNITLIRRQDNIDFGVIACRKSLPSVQRLLTHLEDSIEELEVALGYRKEKKRVARKVVSIRSVA